MFKLLPQCNYVNGTDPSPFPCAQSSILLVWFSLEHEPLSSTEPWSCIVADHVHHSYAFHMPRNSNLVRARARSRVPIPSVRSPPGRKSPSKSTLSSWSTKNKKNKSMIAGQPCHVTWTNPNILRCCSSSANIKKTKMGHGKIYWLFHLAAYSLCLTCLLELHIPHSTPCLTPGPLGHFCRS